MHQTDSTNFCFDSNGKNAAAFTFSEDKLTLKAITGTHLCLECTPALSKSGKSKIAFKIDKGICAIGLTKDRSKNNWNHADACYNYYSEDGKVYYENHEVLEDPAVVSKEGDMLSMDVDMDNKKFCISVNSKVLHSVPIKDTKDEGEWVFYVSLENPGDQITII